MAHRIGIARQIVYVLAERDMATAPTLGDLCDILGLRTGHAIGERLREARNKYGFDIHHFTTRSDDDKLHHRYLLPVGERERVRNLPEFRDWKAGVAA